MLFRLVNMSRQKVSKLNYVKVLTTAFAYDCIVNKCSFSPILGMKSFK